MAGVVVQFGGDSSKLVKSIKDVDAAANQLDQTEKRLTQSAKEMERAAIKAFKDAQTPAQEFQRKMEGLGRVFKDGKISQEEYSVAVRKVKEAYRQIPPELRNVEGNMVRLQMANKETFGQKLLNNINAVKYAIGAVGAAAAAATRIITEMERVRSEAAQQSKDVLGGYAQLGQLSTDSGKVNELRGVARQMFASGIGENLDQASNLVFQLQSAGLMGDRSLFERAARTGLLADPSRTAKEVAGLIKNFEGIDQTGTVSDILSKASAVSAISRESIDVIVQRAAQASSEAEGVMATDEETLAAIGVLTTGKMPEQASTQLRATFRAMGVKGIEGGTFEERIKRLDEMTSTMTQAHTQELLGSSEAVAGFRFLRNQLPMYRQALTDMDFAVSSNAILSQLNNQESDSEIRDVVRHRATMNQLNLSRRGTGRDELWRQRREAENEMAFREMGFSEAGIGIVSAATNFGGAVQSIFDTYSPNSPQNIGAVLMNIWAAAKGTEKNTEKVSRPRVPAPEN